MTDSNANFRSVLRGYDPVQVDQHVRELAQAVTAAQQEAGERTVQVTKLEAAFSQLRTEVGRHVQRIHTLEQEALKAPAPTFASLGERIGSILTLADKEATELRTSAQSDAARHHALADESAQATRRDAEHYATEMRSAADAEAARFMDDVKRQADSIMDDADRRAMARTEEAEAVYERARAKSATAAVEFESTLAARRDASALEFAAGVTAAEQQLAAVRLQSEQTLIESEQAQQEAASRSAQQLEQAMNQAHTLVADAKTKAERIRGDSERELTAATHRRDSINAQLSNVRQMLAALGGAGIVNLDAAEPATGTPKAAAAAPAAKSPTAATGTDEAATTKQADPKTDVPANDKAKDRKADPSPTVSAKS